MKLSIDDLLKALQNPEKKGKLDNTSDTWRRIGENDSFDELNLEKSDLQAFLDEWVKDNPYNNI